MGATEVDKAASFISANGGLRASQACDRCRMKKIKCDGAKPCNKCAAVGFECTTSDKLSRRAFPKGYTVNLEKRVMELEEENQRLKAAMQSAPARGGAKAARGGAAAVTVTSQQNTFTINNPVDQIFNLDQRGMIIGNDNLNYESQLNHLLIKLRLPFLKITNSHNFLVNDPDSYLYHRSYAKHNDFHNRDVEAVCSPLTVRAQFRGRTAPLPVDAHELFLHLVSNFKRAFASRRQLDAQVRQFFLNHNTLIPIFDYAEFMAGYEAFHTMYPFMFTYGDATINGYNLTGGDVHAVGQYLLTVVQLYAMVSVNDPALNLNLLLNHRTPGYTGGGGGPLVESLYELLPYLNVLNVSMAQLQTYLLFLYYAMLTNNKVKSLLLSSLVNAYIGLLGVNMNCSNLFFNDLSLTAPQRRERVKVFWGFKVLLKCFNLKFGYKPTINTTVINPVTIERYFSLTPEKLSSLIDPAVEGVDPLFKTLLAPSVEFLNLMNIVIPSSFSPNYYQYLKQDGHAKRRHHGNLDWILNDGDGDGNDGNLNYNYTQFVTIDNNLAAWRRALRDKPLDCVPLASMGLAVLPATAADTSLHHRIPLDTGAAFRACGLSQDGRLHFAAAGVPDVHTAVQLVRMQLNFHYLLIRSMNYLNFVVDRELTPSYYDKMADLAREALAYFVVIFEHVGESSAVFEDPLPDLALAVDVDVDTSFLNDFSAKRRAPAAPKNAFPAREVPQSPFNAMLNGLSLTMINIKKSIVLQMLYLLICSLRSAGSGGGMPADTHEVLMQSIVLFTRVFINYRPGAARPPTAKKSREDALFRRLLDDDLRADILRSADADSDDDDDAAIDWDDEHLDEDLKYLKILKYVQYKTESLPGAGARMDFANPRAWPDPYEGPVPAYLQGLPSYNFQNPAWDGRAG